MPFFRCYPVEPIPAWIDADYKATYGQKSEPVADKSKYKPKQFYLDHLTTTHAQIVARLKEMKPADFQASHPDPARRERFPTVGHAVMFYGTWHEAYHSGQLRHMASRTRITASPQSADHPAF